MQRTLIPLLALLAAGPQGRIRGEELREVSAVRCWSLSDATRVVIEVSGEFEFHAERAHGPERIFFDVQHSRPRIKGHRFYSESVADKLVKKVRVAETAVGTTRVVLDLQGDADYSATELSNPDRLVVELRAKPAAAPPQAAPPVTTQALPPPPNLAPSQTPGAGSPWKSATAVPPAGPALRPETNPARSRAAKLSSDGSLSLTRALGLKIRRIVLDPGHGGHDEGTSGPTGLLEKDLVLDVSLRLGKLIESRMGSEVIFTRTDDTFIPLENRTAIANEKEADLFLSVHANSSPYPRIGGVESYYLNFTTSPDALAVASRENASSGKSVFALPDLLQKMALNDKLDESKEFAHSVQSELFTFEARNRAGIKNRGVKKAPFVVLIGAHMPSVLAEIGFLSNAKEEALLRKPEERKKLAEALYYGVSNYAKELSHFDVARSIENR
jgi:N-acetylmuramoyl-L-alanine amidase